jgi:hypothetical protein
MSTRLTIKHQGVGEMLNASFLRRHLERVGHAIASYAEAIAPVGPPTDPHAGRYKASFHVRSHTHGGATHDRAEVIVWNDAPEAMFVEWGSAGAEPYHTLLRAAVEGSRL